MKRTHRTLLLLAAAALIVVQACRPKPEGELGDPYNKVEGLAGSWTLQSVVQTDEKAPDKRQLDLSNYYLDNGGATIIFDKNNQTYTTDFGSGKNFFGSNGSWEMENSQFAQFDNLYPDVLWLISDGDSLELTLGQPVRSFDSQLYLRLERKCLDEGVLKVRSSYEFEFVRN